MEQLDASNIILLMFSFILMSYHYKLAQACWCMSVYSLEAKNDPVFEITFHYTSIYLIKEWDVPCLVLICTLLVCIKSQINHSSQIMRLKLSLTVLLSIVGRWYRKGGASERACKGWCNLGFILVLFWL